MAKTTSACAAILAALLFVSTAAAQIGNDLTSADFRDWLITPLGGRPVPGVTISVSPASALIRNTTTNNVMIEIQATAFVLRPDPCESKIRVHATMSHSAAHTNFPFFYSRLTLSDQIFNYSTVPLTVGGTATSVVWDTHRTRPLFGYCIAYVLVPPQSVWGCSKPVVRQACGATMAIRASQTTIDVDARIGRHNPTGPLLVHWDAAASIPLPLIGWHGQGGYYVNPTLSFVLSNGQLHLSQPAHIIAAIRSGTWQLFDLGATPSSGWLHKIL